MQKISDVDFLDSGNKCDYYVNEKGNKEGVCILYHKNGNQYLETEYKDGKKEGKETSYYEDNALWSTREFKNDLITGITKVYYCGALRSYMSCKDGKFDGEFIIRNFSIKSIKLPCEIIYHYYKKEVEFVWKYYIDQEIASALREEWRDIKYCYKGWKILTKLIDNKKKRKIMKHMIENKNKFYSLQNDNIVFKIIMEYIGFDDMKSILERLKQ